MRTFLTTDRMSPELRARVERAVSQGTRARRTAASLGMSGPFAADRRPAGARLVPIAVALVVAALAWAGWLYDKRAVAAERAAILADVDARRALLPPSHATLLADVDARLGEAARATSEPDLVDASVRGALDRALARPSIYARGPAADLADAARLALVARASDKDAFLFCLYQPPASDKERDLVDRVRGVYFAGAKVDDATKQVRRLAEARTALALLGPAFEANVRAAPDFATLHRLRKDLEGSSLESARKTAAAEVVLVVADAPGDVARVSLVEIGSGKVLVRAARKAREVGKSASALIHRAEIDACDLAVAVRRAAE